MYICPSCQTVLIQAQNQFGRFWFCPSCQGSCSTIELIRKAIPAKLVNQLWQRAKEENISHKRKCPSCRQLMSEIAIVSDNKTEYLDVCVTCRMLWFDTQEYQRLPKNPIEPGENDFLKKMTPEQREKYAMAQLAMLKEKQELQEKVERHLHLDSRHNALSGLAGLIFHALFHG
jgi:Zn-finger nucleic acid-binding protein